VIVESLVSYVVVYALLEFYEVYWQRSETLMGMLERMYGVYAKSSFLFLVMHPTLFFAFWFVLKQGYEGYAVALLLLKATDVMVKMYLIKGIFIDNALSAEIREALSTPIGNYLPYVGLVIYPFFIVMSFVTSPW